MCRLSCNSSRTDGIRTPNPEKDRLLTPQFIVSVARGPDVAKVHTRTDLCGLRVKVEAYNAPRGPCNENAASALDTRSVTAAMHPGVLLAMTRTHPGSVPLQSSSLVLQLRRKPHFKLSWSQKVEKSKGGCCKASALEARPKGWRLHAPASA
jgi:hypothetical protein